MPEHYASCCRSAAGLLALLLLTGCDGLLIDSDERFDRARESLAAGDRNAAVVDLKAFLQSRPEHVEARLLLGESLLETADIAGAAKEFSRALEILETAGEAESDTEAVDPDYVRRGHMGLALARIAQQDYTGALESLELLIDDYPDEPRLRQLAARAAFVGQRDEDAARHLEALLAVTPDEPTANFMLGVVHLRSGRPDEAERLLDRSISLRPDDDIARLVVAQIKNGLGKPLAALDLLIPVLERSGVDASAARVLGGLDFSDEDVADAVLARAETLERAAPDTALPPILRGSALLATGRDAEAAEAFAAATDFGGGRYAVVGSFVAYRRDGNLAAARAVAEEWVESNPDDTAFRSMLATDYIGEGEFESAVDAYERLLEEQGDNPLLLNNLAWLYAELGDERAIDLARRAHRLAPESAAIMDTLGWALVRNGETEEGIELLYEAVDRAPRVNDIRAHLVQALRTVDREDEANRVLSGMADAPIELPPDLQDPGG